MSSHPFITTTVVTQSFDTVATEKINTIYIVGTKGSGGTIGNNEIKQIGNITEFDAIVGANASSKPAFKFLRSIDGSVPVFFVNGFSSIVTPTLSDNLLAGLVEIGKNIRLQPGIIICPETSGLTTTIASFFDAAQNLVSNPLLNWEYYHNLSLTANDKTKALAEAVSLSSPQGHSSVFFGYGKDTDNNQIPLSVVAAARNTFLNRNRRGYFSPSAFQESIPFSAVDTQYLPKWYIGVDEYTELNDKGINSIFLDGDGTIRRRYSLCGARTLSKDASWRYQNTRYAANNVFYRAAQVLKPFLFLPADISSIQNAQSVPGLQESITNADIILSLQVLLSELKAEGAFSIPPTLSDGTQPESFVILPSRLPDGNLAITIEIYLVQTREKVSLSFVKKG